MWNDYFSVLCDHPADPMSGPLKCWVSAQRRNKKRLTAEEREALESIPGWVWKTRKIKNRYSWDEQLAALREYVAANNGLPKQTYERLGGWINRQRTNKNKLTPEKKAALETVPGWVWKHHDSKNKYSWDEQLAALREYVVANNGLPKQGHERLGRWIQTQRLNKDKLAAEKKAALEAISDWVWKRFEVKNKYSWDEQHAALRKYVAKHNEIPKTTHERLGAWINNQRQNKDSLTAEKKAALEAIPGWVWKKIEIKNKYSWDEQHAALREYVAKHNELPKTTHERFGAWIRHQRARKDGLTAKKQAALEAIPGWVWKMREVKNKYSWDAQLAALRKHVAAKNRLPKQAHESLGQWVSTQRQQYRKQKLSAARIDGLQSVPLWHW